MKKHTLLQRLLPLAMLAAMLLSAVPAAAAFRDTAGHWAEKTLDEWQDEGLIDGYGDGSFQPNGTVTRAEFIKLVNRTLGLPRTRNARTPLRTLRPSLRGQGAAWAQPRRPVT